MHLRKRLLFDTGAQRPVLLAPIWSSETPRPGASCGALIDASNDAPPLLHPSHHPRRAASRQGPMGAMGPMGPMGMMRPPMMPMMRPGGDGWVRAG